MSTDRCWTVLCVRLIKQDRSANKQYFLQLFLLMFGAAILDFENGVDKVDELGNSKLPVHIDTPRLASMLEYWHTFHWVTTSYPCGEPSLRTCSELSVVCSYLFAATCNLIQVTHSSSLLFLSSVAAVETLPVLQISHAQQECGQLFPAQQRRIPPSLSPHHHTSTPTISSPLLRIPPGLWALSLPIPVRQS